MFNNLLKHLGTLREQVQGRVLESSPTWLVTLSSLVVKASEKWWIRWSMWLGAAGVFGLVAVLSSAYIFLSPLTPHARDLSNVELHIPLKILTFDGQLIGEYGEEQRAIVKYEQLPPFLVKAIISVEDGDFFTHGGVDLTALLRATYKLIINRGKRSQGGGTITMQVARNYMLDRDKTFFRKFREILLALRLEKFYQKEQILEFYINYNFLGARAYGVAAASEIYFDKSLAEITIEEGALIAGLAVAPSRLNPKRYPKRAKVRRDFVLRRMFAEGYIDEQTMLDAVVRPVITAEDETDRSVLAGHVAELARLEVVNLWGSDAYKKGYKVYTTLDSKLQASSVAAVKESLEDYDKRHGWRKPINRIEAFSSLIDAELNESNFLAFDQFNKFDATGLWIDPPQRAQRVLDALEDYENIYDYYPVIVLAVERDAARVLNQQGELQTVYLDQSYSWARPRIEVPGQPVRFGPPPRLMLDLLRRGDVVWIDPAGERGGKIVQLPEVEGAQVFMQSHTGNILAMVGGYSFRRSKFNRISQANVQAGSVFKPFIYAMGLNQGMHLATVIDDAPIVIDDDQLEEEWRPSNASGNWLGPLRLREALVRSVNLVSIRLLRSLGVARTRKKLKEVFQFQERHLAADLSLALGNVQLFPLEIARSYATFSNGGYAVQPRLISRIEDHNGNVVWRNPSLVTPGYQALSEHPDAPAGPDANQDLSGNPVIAAGSASLAKQVLDPRITFLIADTLREVLTRGTAKRAAFLKRDDFAGKTGTSNDAVSTWFCSFNGEVTSVSWAGFDTSKSLGEKEAGSTTPLDIWMKAVSNPNYPIAYSPIPRPNQLVAARIDAQTGSLVSGGSFGAIFELFRTDSTIFETSSGLSSGLTDAFEIHPEDVF